MSLNWFGKRKITASIALVLVIIITLPIYIVNEGIVEWYKDIKDNLPNAMRHIERSPWI